MHGKLPIAALALLLCCLALFAPAISSRAGAEPPDSAAPQPKGVQVSLETDRANYQADQPVQFRLMLTNSSTRPVTLRFKDRQRFDVMIMDRSGKVLWRWAEGQVFAQEAGQETLEPGEFRSYAAVFRGTLPAATYWVRGDVVSTDGLLTDRTVFTVK